MKVSADGHAEAMSLVQGWESRGTYLEIGAHRVFVVDIPAQREVAAPLLVLHGFPTSSFDLRSVADGLARQRHVVLFDMVGYGFSDKPDLAYTLALQADTAVGVCAALGLSSLSLLSHDMGDSVCGELLARHLDGTWPVEVVSRVVTNGSIYIEMAQLSAGQQLLLSVEDRALDEATTPPRAALAAGLAATFSPHAAVDPVEAAAMAALVEHGGGSRLLSRTIRYIEERHRYQDRWTGALERHPAPLGIVWGVDDPIAVVAMSERLHHARPDAHLSLLGGVGHYPMVEAPERFLSAVSSGLG